jgi:endonuclease/exonuclease/phosphatase family metal-dependent hydrolase
MAMLIHGRRLALAIGAACIAMALGAAVPSSTHPAQFRPGPSGAGPDDRSGLSVMTYNVKGLPWPLALGREADLARIGERLAAYRRAGRQPAVVVLQEAFTDSAKRIGRAAGYRYVAAGPERDEVTAARRDPSHQAFLRAGSMLAGEGIGKQTDSGLLILSDHPILGVKRVAFPAHACAGFDCLANKGMVMALVRVPGMDRPVAIITAHLNARKASGVAIDRANQAYRWQVETLDGFIREARVLGVPVILAGDLNVGRTAPRRELMRSYAARWIGGPDGDRGALDACVTGAVECDVARPDDARRALRHNKDWQLAIPGGGVALRPHGVDVPFGREPGGQMLSDHAGYVVRYRVAAATG